MALEDKELNITKLLSFTCNNKYVVSVRRGFLLLLVLEMGCVIILLHSLRLPYNYFAFFYFVFYSLLRLFHYFDLYQVMDHIDQPTKFCALNLP